MELRRDNLVITLLLLEWSNLPEWTTAVLSSTSSRSAATSSTSSISWLLFVFQTHYRYIVCTTCKYIGDIFSSKIWRIKSRNLVKDFFKKSIQEYILSHYPFDILAYYIGSEAIGSRQKWEPALSRPFCTGPRETVPLTQQLFGFCVKSLFTDNRRGRLRYRSH